MCQRSRLPEELVIVSNVFVVRLVAAIGTDKQPFIIVGVVLRVVDLYGKGAQCWN